MNERRKEDRSLVLPVWRCLERSINLSALIKLYLTKEIKKDLNEVTENGMTVAEELELLAMAEEGSTGEVFHSADELIKHLNEAKWSYL